LTQLNLWVLKNSILSLLSHMIKLGNFTT
jgi:hypothetical protein